MADTRAKVQITVDRLEGEVSELRAELSDLKGLRTEVQQLRSEMVTMPRVEQKLADLNLEIQKTLKLILENVSTPKTECVTPSAAPITCSGINSPQQPIHISADQVPVTTSPAIPQNLQAAFELHSSAPGTNIPGISTSMPPVTLFTDSTHTTTVR